MFRSSSPSRFHVSDPRRGSGRRPLAVALVLSLALGSAVLAAASRPGGSDAGPIAGGPTAAPSAPPSVTPRPTPVPIPGHEVYGFLPYWEMDDGIAAHLAQTPLTTLALFSVTHRRNGAISPTQTGYRRITGSIGARLIREAHERGVRVELVYTSFGFDKNADFYTNESAQERTVRELVALVDELDLDGVNVDVELLSSEHIPAFGAFVARLRAALLEVRPNAQVSVATGANFGGAAMARAAIEAGADRIFLMGYDYHWSGSAPGPSAPLARGDGDEKHLRWSLDLYYSFGVPVERTHLGLPLYGMIWPAVSGELGAAGAGRGAAWIPRRNLGFLADPPVAPVFDPIGIVDFYAVPDGDGWKALYVDSPETLGHKFALANERGLAGIGLWALGYERGQPAFTELIASFHAGQLVVPSR